MDVFSIVVLLIVLIIIIISQFSLKKTQKMILAKKNQKLDINESEIISFSDEKKEKPLTIDLSDYVEVIPFNLQYEDDIEYNKAFIKLYFAKLIEFVRSANTKIIVLDYLAHHKKITSLLNEDKSNFLDKMYQKYYQAIEETLQKNKNFIYIRVLQLPLDNNLQNEDEIITKTLELIFPETFKHISNLKKSSKFQLYIIPKAIRSFSYMLIDDKFMLTEYDRYNHLGDSIPDTLFIDKIEPHKKRKNGLMNHFVNLKKEEINLILKNKETINLEKFLGATKKAIKQIESEENKAKEKLKEVESKIKRIEKMERNIS